MFCFFQGTQKRVRNSRGKRAINVRAIEVLLYYNIIDWLLENTIWITYTNIQCHTVLEIQI